MTDYLNIFQRLPHFFEKRDAQIIGGHPFDDYAAIPALNASLLKHATPCEMFHELRTPQDRQCDMPESRAEAFALGEAAHKAILEPHLFDAGNGIEEFFQYSPTKGLTTKAAQNAFAQDPSRPLVTPEIIDAAKRIRDAVFKNRLADQLLRAQGLHEASAVAWDEELQVMRKARFDHLPGHPASWIMDIKTTIGGINKWELRKAIRKRDYHVQAAWYLDTLRLISGEGRAQFLFVFVTKTEPFMAKVAELDDVPRGLLAEARNLLMGGDGMVGRAPMFVNAAREFIQRVQEQHADPMGAWEGYENQEAPEIIDSTTAP